MFKPKTPISGRLENSSGGWIRTNDLRVMREKPGSGTVDLQTRHFSELNVRWFRRPSQTAVAN